jgi:hypothetical protein
MSAVRASHGAAWRTVELMALVRIADEHGRGLPGAPHPAG